MNQSSDKRLFIIRPPDYEYGNIEPLVSQIEDHFNRILDILKIFTPSNDLVQIQLTVDIFNPEKTSAYAKRESKNPAIYQVRLNAGLSYYLWAASRAFEIPDYDILPWVEECKINSERINNLSKKRILADYAFFIGCYYILLHEISHIILGHLDYLNDVMNLDYLSEFQDEKSHYSFDEIRIRKALEAEADRQAVDILLSLKEEDSLASKQF